MLLAIINEGSNGSGNTESLARELEGGGFENIAKNEPPSYLNLTRDANLL